MFGIEIRKVGNVTNLYRDVDILLRNNGIKRSEVPADVRRSTVAHALHKMLKPEKHCDICTIRECAELCGVFIASERINVYRAMHCVNWSDMLPDYRQQVMAMILDDFRDVLNPVETAIVVQ
jgi:hypothetical protein